MLEVMGQARHLSWAQENAGDRVGCLPASVLAMTPFPESHVVFAEAAILSGRGKAICPNLGQSTSFSGTSGTETKERPARETVFVKAFALDHLT